MKVERVQDHLTAGSNCWESYNFFFTHKVIGSDHFVNYVPIYYKLPLYNEQKVKEIFSGLDGSLLKCHLTTIM